MSEFKVLVLPIAKTPLLAQIALEQELNQFGVAGWRVVGVLPKGEIILTKDG